MARRRIGELLLERGLITSAQLEAALVHQRQYGNRLGAALVAKRFLTEEQLLGALGEALQMPVVDPASAVPDWTAVHLLRARFCEVHELFPMALDEHGGRKVLTVAMADPLNTPAIEEIEFTTRCKVMPAIASRASVLGAIRRWYLRQQPAGPVLPEGQMMLVRPGGASEMVDTRTPERKQSPPAAPPAVPVVQMRDEDVLPDPTPAQNGHVQPLLEQLARRGSLDDDLGFLFGLDEPADTARVARLEKRLAMLIRVLLQKNLLTRAELKRLLEG